MFRRRLPGDVTSDALQPVADRVYRIEDRYVNLYLVDLGKIALVDSGTRHADVRIRAGLRALGKEVEDIAVVLLTHHHVDHIGTASIWKREIRAEIDIHRIDAPVAAGRERRRLHGIGLGPKVMTAFMGVFVPLMRTPPVEADRLLETGQVLDILGSKIEVIAAPGHTLGSSAFFLRDSGVLFAGDAVNGRRGKPEPPIVAEDAAAATESFLKLTSLGAAILLPGHGSPVRRI